MNRINPLRSSSVLDGVADTSSHTSAGALRRVVRCPSGTFLCCLLASQRPSIGFQHIPFLWEVHMLIVKYLHKIQKEAQILMISNHPSPEDMHHTLQREM